MNLKRVFNALVLTLVLGHCWHHHTFTGSVDTSPLIVHVALTTVDANGRPDPPSELLHGDGEAAHFIG
jgi:hypothetical protein